MTRTTLLAASLATAAALGALGATAQQAAPAQSPAPAQQSMTIAQIATMLEGKGYTIREIEFEHGRYDVEMTDTNGLRVEAYLDPATGAVLYRDDD